MTMEVPIMMVLITMFGVPIAIAIALLFAMRDSAKQHEEMLRENEEYYQKMKSGNENPKVIV